jgi:hypothetical protein
MIFPLAQARLQTSRMFDSGLMNIHISFMTVMMKKLLYGFAILSSDKWDVVGSNHYLANSFMLQLTADKYSLVYVSSSQALTSYCSIRTPLL